MGEEGRIAQRTHLCRSREVWTAGGTLRRLRSSGAARHRTTELGRVWQGRAIVGNQQILATRRREEATKTPTVSLWTVKHALKTGLEFENQPSLASFLSRFKWFIACCLGNS